MLVTLDACTRAMTVLDPRAGGRVKEQEYDEAATGCSLLPLTTALTLTQALTAALTLTLTLTLALHTKHTHTHTHTHTL